MAVLAKLADMRGPFRECDVASDDQHFVKIAALLVGGQNANQAKANSVLLPDASRPDPS